MHGDLSAKERQIDGATIASWSILVIPKETACYL